MNELVPLIICYFNYIDTDYEGRNLFKQPDKGMDFVLRHMKVVYTKKL